MGHQIRVLRGARQETHTGYGGMYPRKLVEALHKPRDVVSETLDATLNLFGNVRLLETLRNAVQGGHQHVGLLRKAVDLFP